MKRFGGGLTLSGGTGSGLWSLSNDMYVMNASAARFLLACAHGVDTSTTTSTSNVLFELNVASPVTVINPPGIGLKCITICPSGIEFQNQFLDVMPIS